MATFDDFVNGFSISDALYPCRTVGELEAYHRNTPLIILENNYKPTNLLKECLGGKPALKISLLAYKFYNTAVTKVSAEYKDKGLDVLYPKCPAGQEKKNDPTLASFMKNWIRVAKPAIVRDEQSENELINWYKQLEAKAAENTTDDLSGGDIVDSGSDAAPSPPTAASIPFSSSSPTTTTSSTDAGESSKSKRTKLSVSEQNRSDLGQVLAFSSQTNRYSQTMMKIAKILYEEGLPDDFNNLTLLTNTYNLSLFNSRPIQGSEFDPDQKITVKTENYRLRSAFANSYVPILIGLAQREKAVSIIKDVAFPHHSAICVRSKKTIIPKPPKFMIIDNWMMHNLAYKTFDGDAKRVVDNEMVKMEKLPAVLSLLTINLVTSKETGRPAYAQISAFGRLKTETSLDLYKIAIPAPVANRLVGASPAAVAAVLWHHEESHDQMENQLMQAGRAINATRVDFERLKLHYIRSLILTNCYPPLRNMSELRLDEGLENNLFRRSVEGISRSFSRDKAYNKRTDYILNPFTNSTLQAMKTLDNLATLWSAKNGGNKPTATVINAMGQLPSSIKPMYSTTMSGLTQVGKQMFHTQPDLKCDLAGCVSIADSVYDDTFTKRRLLFEDHDIGSTDFYLDLSYPVCFLVPEKAVARPNRKGEVQKFAVDAKCAKVDDAYLASTVNRCIDNGFEVFGLYVGYEQIEDLYDIIQYEDLHFLLLQTPLNIYGGAYVLLNKLKCGFSLDDMVGYTRSHLSHQIYLMTNVANGLEEDPYARVEAQYKVLNDLADTYVAGDVINFDFSILGTIEVDKDTDIKNLQAIKADLGAGFAKFNNRGPKLNKEKVNAKKADMLTSVNELKLERYSGSKLRKPAADEKIKVPPAAGRGASLPT
jgi:hypothetical protein